LEAAIMLDPDKIPTDDEIAEFISMTAADLRFEMRNGALFAIKKTDGEAMRVRSDSLEGWLYCR
jgi:hypothetical protein